jgi:hypothetical protein
MVGKKRTKATQIFHEAAKLIRLLQIKIYFKFWLIFEELFQVSFHNSKNLLLV